MGEGNGFIWRLQSIALYEERDGGVYVELEAIGLTRDIPAAIRWMATPLVTRLTSSTLAASLRQTREGIAVRPTILGPRHNSEHVFRAQRDSSPVVRFDFGHRYDEVGSQHGPRQPQMIEPRVGRPCGNFDQFVAVQINEVELLPSQLGFQPTLGKHEVRIPLVARSLSDHNAASAETSKCLRRSAH